MCKPVPFLLLLCWQLSSWAQPLGALSVEKIMRHPSWIGTSPSGPEWSLNSTQLFFRWNPEKALADSLYYITRTNKTPVKATPVQTREQTARGRVVYNLLRQAYVYARDGDIFYTDVKTGVTKQVTQTIDAETNPVFSFNDTRIVYTRNQYVPNGQVAPLVVQNLFAWDIAGGETIQLTNVKAGSDAARPAADAGSKQQEEWLKNDQLRYLEVLRQRKEKREKGEAYNKPIIPKETRAINLDGRRLETPAISPDGRFLSYRLLKDGGGARTAIPNYVTESGFTTNIAGADRPKVGTPPSSSTFHIYDRGRDTIFTIKTDSLPGIKELPLYLKDYPKQWEQLYKNPRRGVTVSAVSWSPRSSHAVLEIRSQDNKDRWFMLWDTATAQLQLLDRQHDEAWIGGPGISFGRSGWVDEHTFWFQSEVTGYSHLYTINVNTKERKALTTGNYEVQEAQLSIDKKYFFITTNEVQPGEQQFYRLTIASRLKERITTMTGANQVSISPDEKYLAILYSYSNKPWELYLQENKPGSKAEQVTFKAQSDEFRSYPWRDPELVTFTARDGAQVYARIYKPANPHPNKPAVLFVHGAGYLQNAHKWWSSYYREFMFNNMLADNGYYVMDIDYRGSAGYGRDWRTGIYRHMGGKDLSDHTDAVSYLVKNYGVHPQHVGLYGGSYGGFITLMALFTEPNVFTAGAALRPVTDWANYNHGYTSNILNEPFTDSIAYRKSSPIYFANGLKGHLLICHGMVDINVHYQDAVKLTQRLIELNKDNWELASYPMEDHGFVEPSSWTDEYRRIYKLFEGVLKK